MLTSKQEKVLKVIIDYIEREKIPPTVRELCEITETKSTSTIHGHLNRLEKKGYISKREGSSRSLRVLKSF